MGAQLEAMDQPKFGGGDDDNKDATAVMNNKRVALITGSGSGIGANIAVDLARAGFFVVVTGRNRAQLDKVVQQCNEAALVSATSTNNSPSTVERDANVVAGTAAAAFVADLLDLKQVDQLIDFVRAKFNRLDVLVNNACWRGSTGGNMLTNADHRTTTAAAATAKLDDFNKVMHINVSVPVYLISKCLIPLKIKGSPSQLSSAQLKLPPQSSSSLSADGDQPAVVINISSSASQVVVPLHFYSISKACLSEMSRQVAVAAQTCGILSVTISPGPVLTEGRPHHAAMSNLTLMNRVGTTQEVSNLVLFAIAHAHLFNGQELNIDGGYTAKEKR